MRPDLSPVNSYHISVLTRGDRWGSLGILRQRRCTLPTAFLTISSHTFSFIKFPSGLHFYILPGSEMEDGETMGKYGGSKYVVYVSIRLQMTATHLDKSSEAHILSVQTKLTNLTAQDVETTIGDINVYSIAFRTLDPSLQKRLYTLMCYFTSGNLNLFFNAYSHIHLCVHFLKALLRTFILMKPIFISHIAKRINVSIDCS